MMEPPAAQPPVVLPIERAAAALEVALCSGFPTQIVIITVLATFGLQPRLADGRFNATFVFALTLLDTLLLVGLICFFLRAHRESIREQLFGHRQLGLELWLGLALIPASFGVMLVTLLLVQLIAPSLRNVLQNPLAELATTRSEALVFAFVVVIAGGVREEIQRGFVLRRFEQYLGGGLAGLGPSPAALRRSRARRAGDESAPAALGVGPDPVLGVAPVGRGGRTGSCDHGLRPGGLPAGGERRGSQAPVAAGDRGVDLG